jgi:hypothetical protein
MGSMTQTVPTIEPATLTAGDTAKWQKSLPDYPASAGWVLSYVLVKTGAQITFSATASGDDHLVNVATATTAAWSVGRYQYQAFVSKSGERFTASAGQIEVRPNFSAATTGIDARSHARKTLEAVEAVLEGRASQAQQEYQIGDRQLKYTPLGDLLKLRSLYRAEVTAELNAEFISAGLAPRNKLLTRF